MSKRAQWKFIVLLAVVLVGGAGLCFLLSRPQNRTQFVGPIDTKSGYRCRFTISSDWKTNQSGLGFQSFILPPSPARQWMYSHILYKALPLPPQIDLMDAGLKNFFNGFCLVDGYPELGPKNTGRILAHRHISKDGYPATLVTVSLGPKRATGMLVYIPDHALLYVISGTAEPANFAPTDREMQAVITSFHIEKVRIPTRDKR